MNKVKKLVLILSMTLLLMGTMAGCGQKDEGISPDLTENTEMPENTEAPEETEAPAPTPEVTPEPTATPEPTPEPLQVPVVEPAATDAYTGGVMRPEMTAKEFAQQMGIGINLGNTFEAYWEDLNKEYTGAQTIGMNTPANYESCWGAVLTTQEAIDGMKAAGFSTVRIPVYWGNMMQNDGAFVIDMKYLQRVEEVINYCLKNELYVVLNIHHYDEFLIENFSEDEVVEITNSLWSQIAQYFVNYSDYLIFEGFNEALGNVQKMQYYTDRQKYLYVNRMNQTFVDAVRATGGNNANRMLIASGFWTNIDYTTKENFIVPTDTVSDRIMVSVHYVDNSMYWSNRIGGQAWWDYSVAQCELLKAAFTDKGYQVFIGECTANYPDSNFASDAMYGSSSECLEKMMNLITDYGFVPVLWDVNDGFYSRTENKIKSDSDAAVIRRIADKLK